jgi:hypothetical protein
MSRMLNALLIILACLVLGAAWAFSESFRILLGVGVVLVVGAIIAWLRVFRPGPITLTDHTSIRAHLETLREGASAISAIWSGKYDAAEVGAYFQDEKSALETNELLRIQRVINPAVIPDEHFDLLQSMREKFGGRFVLLEDSTLRSFELYIADYPGTSTKDPVAVVVINNTDTGKPEVAIVLDPARDKGLRGAVESVRKWWNTISEGLPAFDPVAIERWDHIATRYTELVTQNANKIEFLDQYSKREKQIIGDHLRTLADQGHELTLVEVGCGDGRALLSYVPSELANRTAYVLGLDYAPAMISAAEKELARHQMMGERIRPDVRKLVDKTAFFQLNAEKLRRFFNDGRLDAVETLLEASSSADEGSLDPNTYGASRKVFCCLLNTIGVIEPVERRVAVLTTMLACLGIDDTLMVTVFAAERFEVEAKALYGDLEEMINATIEDVQFDQNTATFRVDGTPGYYSHWFEERELHELVNDATEPLVKEGRIFDPVRVEQMGNGGYFVLVQRTG